MTTLVTGATGFVGAAVARHLLAAGHRVRALVRDGTPRTNLDGLDVEITVGDLTDRASLDRAAAGCETVFHVAADYRLWVPDPRAMHRANVDGTRNVMLAALGAGVRRVVYTSSIAALAYAKGGVPANEDSAVTFADMIGPYKQTKFLAEEVVRALAGSDGLPVVIVNPSTPVGARDIKPTPTGKMIHDAIRGRMPAYVDAGLNIVNVEDVAAGHLLALEKGVVGQRYILGGENVSLRELLERIASLVGGRAPWVRLPHLAILPVAYAVEAFARVTGRPAPFSVDAVKISRNKEHYSSAKAVRDLGYAPRPIEDGLRDAIAWFAAHGS